jgi:hypothetical protein
MIGKKERRVENESELKKEWTARWAAERVKLAPAKEKNGGDGVRMWKGKQKREEGEEEKVSLERLLLLV